MGYQSDGKIPESMCWNEMRQCRTTPKSEKAQAKKAAAKTQKVPSKQQGTPKGKVFSNSAARPTSPVLKQVEVSSKATTMPSIDTRVNKTGMGGEMDMETYLRSLALEDGLSMDAYSKQRPKQDWDKLIVAMASSIYNRHSA